MRLKDTPPGEPPATGRAYREVKLKPDGTEISYDTSLVHRDAGLVIVRFLMQAGGGPPRLPVIVPPGSVSYGYFWARRPYNVYRWLDPVGVLIAHRFDAVTDVRITGGEVRYRDLALDWWALPDGTLIEEDRDELDALARSGVFSAKDLERANEAARQVFSRYRHIIDEVGRLERKFVFAT
jgi:predicted RNA-binding protein associated with RNAse of E/G family